MSARIGGLRIATPSCAMVRNDGNNFLLLPKSFLLPESPCHCEERSDVAIRSPKCGLFMNRPYEFGDLNRRDIVGQPMAGHATSVYRGISFIPPRYAAKASPGICLWDDLQTGVGSKGGAVSASPSLGRFFFPYSF